MTDRGTLALQARAVGLVARGVIHDPALHPLLPDSTRTLLLLGPDEPSFWGIFKQSREYLESKPDPMDRWSKRVCRKLARDWQGTALFPSDGPPYAPFIQWALESGQSWTSPVGLLIQRQAGLFISFRAAIALPYTLDTEARTQPPCDACSQPCLTACPVNALGSEQAYDVAACKAHLRRPEGRECRDSGCLVRRACPVAQDFLRNPQQSAFHMAAFLKN